MAAALSKSQTIRCKSVQKRSTGSKKNAAKQQDEQRLAEIDAQHDQALAERQRACNEGRPDCKGADYYRDIYIHDGEKAADY